MNKQLKSNDRPVLIIQRSIIENFLEVFSFLLFAIFISFFIIIWKSIPDAVPVHFNIYGEIDKWGSKNSLIFLPTILSIIYIFMTILIKYPHKYNYIVRIDEENALRQYKLARILILSIKSEMLIIFLYVEWIIFSGIFQKKILFQNILFFIVTVIFFVAITIGYYMYKSKKLK